MKISRSLLVASLFSFVGVLALPLTASAHVKWFVEEGAENIEPYALTESWVIIWIVAVLGALGTGMLIEKKWPPRRTNRKRWSANLVRLYQTLVGAWLLISAYTGVIFVPLYTASSVTDQALRAVMIVTGILMIFGIASALSSILLLGTYIALGVMFGWVAWFEQAAVLGIALAYWMVQSKPSQFMSKYSHLAIPILRVTLGIALIAPALTEKLLRPDLAQQFLYGHDWNFMQLLGFTWFDDRLFILSVGMSELLLGLLLIFGILTRFTVAGLFFMFTTTAILLGIGEVIGHLPLITAGIILIVYGSGTYTIRTLFRGKGRRRSSSGGGNSSSDDEE